MLSVCIFGSQARRSADAQSDRDILLVGPDSPMLDRTRDRWAAHSWNVTVLSPAAFSRMAEVKALFVQHIKQEGRILRDDNDFISSQINTFRPKETYYGERNDAFSQILSLPKITENYWRNLCIADIAYVLFRNAAILHFASHGEYQFNYQTLVGRVAGLFNLEKRDSDALKVLRTLKHGYRNRIDDLESIKDLSTSIDAIQRIAKQLNLDESSTASGKTSLNYFRLRLVELGLVSRHDPRKLDAGTGTNLYSLWRRIASARGYPDPRVAIH